MVRSRGSIFFVLLMASMALVYEGRGEECYDKTWYEYGTCETLSSCEFEQELQCRRVPQICPQQSGSNESFICCPRRFSLNVYTEVQGSSCFHQTWHIFGTCLPLEDCLSAKDELRNGVLPQTCDSGVCCVPSVATCSGMMDGGYEIPSSCPCLRFTTARRNQPMPNSVAESKCLEYSNYVCAGPVWFRDEDKLFGSFNDFCYHNLSEIRVTHTFGGRGYELDHITVHMPVAGGERVAHAQNYPHMALLGYGPRDDITFQCGGSLIAPDFILTAAHCGQLLEVQEVILHPKYSKKVVYNDIALLRLKRPARMTATVRPACLHKAPVEMGQYVTAAGWGNMYEGYEHPSEVLLRRDLRLRPLRRCQKLVDSRKAPRGLSSAYFLCAGGEDIGDTCRGDSGGPVVVLRHHRAEPYCTFSILGLVAFGGLTCGTGPPSVYTRVAPFVPWIERIVWPLG